MAKKLNWLDQFAEEQAKKLRKTASAIKTAEQIIVDPSDVGNVQDGDTVEFDGQQYKVVNSKYVDEKGPGVILEKVAFGETENVTPVDQVVSGPKGQEYARTKLETQQTYTNDEDAARLEPAARATEQQIAEENAVDRTTVDGHYTKSPKIDTPTETINVDETVTQDVDIEVETETETEEFDEQKVEDTADEDVVTEDTNTEDVNTEEHEEEIDKKFASNRILARMFKESKK